MKRKIKQSLVGFMLLLMLFQPIFIKADVTDSVAYLEAQTQDPWVTQALVAAGVSGVPTSHLAEVSGTLATDYAKTILALAATGENPATFGSIDYVAKLKTYFSNNQMGDEGLINDDMWSILALASVNEVDADEVVAAKNFILANQNTDGGWGYGVGDDSDTNDTAAAIMALVEAGVSASDSVITDAVSYLQSLQNDDGGFPYNPIWGTDSDSGSDSWVISAIYKIGQNPINWDKGGNNPISHLESLKDSDGGFWWVETSDYNNKAMTAYAVIALSGKSFPIAYYEAPSPSGFHLRIEGKNGNICDEYVEATTAMDIVENGALVCGYTYVISDSAYGPYLSQINDEAGEGMSGWMYFVNNESLMVGAGDYTLSEGDEILWYYGDWGWQPTRLLVDENNLDSGETILIEVQYFNGGSWFGLEGATVKGGDQEYITGSSGKVSASMPDDSYNLYAEKSGFVRSNEELVLFGQQSIPQSIGLVVEIEQGGDNDGDGDVLGEAIIFEITPDNVNFGKMNPGNTGLHVLNIENSGTVDLEIEASVTGDSLFTDNLELDSAGWASYNTELDALEDEDVEIGLTVPADYLGSGVKSGELIFWAQAK